METTLLVLQAAECVSCRTHSWMLPLRRCTWYRRRKKTSRTGACSSWSTQCTRIQYRSGRLQSPQGVQYMAKKMPQGMEMITPEMLPKNMTTFMNQAASSGYCCTTSKSGSGLSAMLSPSKKELSRARRAFGKTRCMNAAMPTAEEEEPFSPR